MSNNNTFYGASKIANMMRAGNKHIHFTGIGGVGMYSLAKLAKAQGIAVTGSDRARGEYTELLEREGIHIALGSDPAAVAASSLVVYSLAVDIRDSELQYARRLGIPTVSRADFLSYLMRNYRSRIGVSGSHGKSTVTAMLDGIFDAADLAPTVAAGSVLSFGSPTRIGGDDIFIYEACEYRDSFICLSPTVTVVTNIELDHTDYFDSEEAICASFLRAINNSRELAVLNIDDKNTAALIPSVRVPYVTFGCSQMADYRYTIDRFCATGTEFSLYHADHVTSFTLNVPGAFNVANAAAAIATALEYGIAEEKVRDAICNYRTISRRLEYLGNYRELSVYYDYAHHPTEIAAAIGAVRSWYSENVTVIFRPHTYTRTAALWDGFVRSLSLADRVILTDIFAAREEPLSGITSSRLAQDIGSRAICCMDFEIPEALEGASGALILMGAGNLDAVIKRLGLK